MVQMKMKGRLAAPDRRQHMYCQGPTPPLAFLACGIMGGRLH